MTVTRAAEDCHAVKFVAVRGSGDTLSDFGVLGGKISGALARRAKSSNVDYGAYGLSYPAVGIDWWSFTGTGAAIKLVSYNLSKNKGRDNLRAFIKKELSPSACPNEQLVLEGYSQGAHVVGDVLSKKVGGLTARELSHIKTVALIADPRFNSQEPFVRGYSSFRPGRNGILGARSPGDLASVAGRIRGWCRKDDLVCQGPGTTGNHAQAKYMSDYGDAIINYIVSKLGWTTEATSSSCSAAALAAAAHKRNRSGSGLLLLRFVCAGNLAVGEFARAGQQSVQRGQLIFQRTGGSWTCVLLGSDESGYIGTVPLPTFSELWPALWKMSDLPNPIGF